jgi:flavin-binding protein dodecin
MTMLKVLEVLAQSNKSQEGSARDAKKAVGGIKSIYINEMEPVVEDGKVISFRINAKVSFVLEGS